MAHAVADAERGREHAVGHHLRAFVVAQYKAPALIVQYGNVGGRAHAQMPQIGRQAKSRCALHVAIATT